MEEKRRNNNHKSNLRSKSPIIMSSKSKMALLDCHIHSTPKIHSLNETPKKNQELKASPVNTTNVLPKTLNKLNSSKNLQSTPNTQNLNKSDMDSRIIMNLSPIISTSSLKTKLKCCKEDHHKLRDNLNDLNSSSIYNTHEITDKLKTNEMVKKLINENSMNEKAKRCLFEKENENSTSNLDTEQDSLNISLDVLEEVCQMSEIIDDSLTEEIQISYNTENKKNKLALFLYGNNSTQLDDTKEENELLQLALSLEDNVLNETKLNNKLCFEEEFTSLNQLNKKQTTLSEINKLNTCINYSKCNLLDPLEINDIGNTQMCEIVDITERLESFDNEWTQQYTNNISNLCVEKKENQFPCDLINSNQIISDLQLKSSYDCNGHDVNIKNNDLINNVTDTKLKIVQSMLKDELNEPTVPKNKSFTNPNICKGFSTAGGKSINVSNRALQKAQLILEDELNKSSIIPKDKSITNPNISKGFSTAGGKSINVSDKALQKVQLMLKDELNKLSTVPKDKSFTNPSMCKRFSTTEGKSTNVPDKALQKAQLILEDELNVLSIVPKDKSIANPNICKGFSTDEENYVNVLNKLFKKKRSTNENDVNGMQFNSSLKTNYTICKNFNDRLITTNSTISPNSKSTVFDIVKFEEERNLEDLSLIDTVDKFERDENIYKSIIKNKRSGSPLYNISHKTRKMVHDGRWENDVLKGSFDVYLSKKLNGPRVSLPKVVNWALPKICNIKQFPYDDNKYEFSKLNVDNALHLTLLWKKCNDNINKLYNFQDIKNLFLSHHFVDDNLIPNGWIENHFRLIVWKLASTEISFPDHFGHKILTAKNVIHQLLYRYYREIEKCQRSALKKILEKDETATKRIILCVSKVIKTNIAEVYNIELTDGWYSVQGLIDFEMNMLLHKGIVKVGTKLMTHNAELIGAGEGIDPLKVHDGIKLKISTNSTRRVRWYAKLGFYMNSSLPIPISLESVLPHGGIIGSLSLVILRKYHMMYLERKTNSKSILRNEKMEAVETEKYKAYEQKLLENISNQIETELVAEMASATKKSKFFSSIKKEQLDKLSIDELSNYIDNCADPLEIQSILSEDRLEALKSFKKSEHDRFYNELRNRVDRIFKDQKDTRKVTPLLKLRVVDEKHASTGFKAAILTIWNPSEDVSTIFKKSSEGQCCKVHHLNTNGFIKGELQISTNKNTRFDFQGFKNEYAKRNVIVSFKSIWSSTFLPLFGELDFAGIVVLNINKNNCTYNEIYVSDKEMNVISILFHGDIKDYGYDDMMYPGSIITGVNVQFRGFNKISSIPKLYNTELSSFTTFPRTKYLLNIFDEYKIFFKKPENQDFLKCCQSRLDEIFNKNTEITMTNKEDIKEQCLNTSINIQHRSYGKLPVTLVKTSNTSHSEYSPVQKRLKLLNTYGKTPPLNIVHTKPPEKKLLSQFKTPTRL